MKEEKRRNRDKGIKLSVRDWKRNEDLDRKADGGVSVYLKKHFDTLNLRQFAGSK